MFTPTRSAGEERLAAFLPAAGRAYRERRNFDLGPGERDNVSCLSPWLRRRLLLEAEVLQVVVDRHGGDTAGKFVDEVFWRTYFRGWMAHHPDTWGRYQLAVREGREATETDPELGARLDQAQRGATGIVAFDHWARELVSEGYLHNHARMWFASIWIFTLRLPWALGADFFLRHLLDGDPASNTLGWRWVGGLHTRGKTYLARRENILKFTHGRLDPGPGLAREAPALEEDPLPRTGLALPEPAPLPSPGAAWLVTDEDCRGPERPLMTGGPVVGLLGVDEASPDGVAPPVRDFARGAVRDALARAGQPGADVVTTGQEAAARLLAGAVREGADTVHAWHVPYGPTAALLDTAERALGEAGISLQRHLRAEDRRAWPHASRGFFGLKKRIPAMLEAQGIAPDRVHA